MDYSPHEIESVRNEIIYMRDKSISTKSAPDFGIAVILTHVIKYLYDYIKLLEVSADYYREGYDQALKDLYEVSHGKSIINELD